MKKALVVGGSSGVGLATVNMLLDKGYEHVYIADKREPMFDYVIDKKECFSNKTSYIKVDLTKCDYTLFDQAMDIDTLIITAGFGRVATFENLTDTEIENLIKCNELSAIRIIKKYYGKLKSNNDFYCAIMGSIAGHVTSPLFSVYGASKAGLCHFIENINSELAHDGYKNRILDVSPGSLKGTTFSGGNNDITELSELVENIWNRMIKRELLYIPNYEDVYEGVINRYRQDPIGYGCESYEYKIKGNRISSSPQQVIGYLSGTFDLFHIGHLNLLRRAKEQCDYLIVGVHKSGAWKGKETFIPYEERVEIVNSIKYVDEVVESYTEDSDAYDALNYDKLFVGSDYKGTERFIRYENYFKDKGVEIIYFPYTGGTSSTQLREIISAKIKK